MIHIFDQNNVYTVFLLPSSIYISSIYMYGHFNINFQHSINVILNANPHDDLQENWKNCNEPFIFLMHI